MNLGQGQVRMGSDDFVGRPTQVLIFQNNLGHLNPRPSDGWSSTTDVPSLDDERMSLLNLSSLHTFGFLPSATEEGCG